MPSTEDFAQPKSKFNDEPDALPRYCAKRDPMWCMKKATEQVRGTWLCPDHARIAARRFAQGYAPKWWPVRVGGAS